MVAPSELPALSELPAYLCAVDPRLVAAEAHKRKKIKKREHEQVRGRDFCFGQ